MKLGSRGGYRKKKDGRRRHGETETQKQQVKGILEGETFETEGDQPSLFTWD